MKQKQLKNKITPLIIANNTVVREQMTEEEYKIANEVSTKWIEWIKNNCVCGI